MWDLTCPRCGSTAGILVETGVFRAVGLPLGPDGFEFDEALSVTTDSVTCRCRGCRNLFMLEELRHGTPQAKAPGQP
jgi:hypothetical protein